MATLDEKIKKLKDQFDGEVPETINDLEKQSKAAALFTYLLQFDGVNLLLKMLSDKVWQINEQLQENANLDESSRISLFAKKETYRECIKIFTDKEKQLSNIERRINEELE